MSFEVTFSANARKDIKRLNPVTQKRLRRKIEYFSSLANPLAVAKRMVNSADADYRYRVGNIRILFDFDGHTIAIVRVDKRSDVYRMFSL